MNIPDEQEYCPKCNYVKLKTKICTKCGYCEEEIIPISEEQAYYIACCGCSHFDANNDQCLSSKNERFIKCAHIRDRIKLLKDKGYIK
ncbi:MAG: hypothetical protein ACXAAH_00210 [Promethearchaeota archaeon]|jgi:hypothetical protein